MLRQQRKQAGEHEPLDAVEAPPIAVAGAGRAQDERHAIAGENAAGWPGQNVAGAKDEGSVDGRAHPDGDKDLRDGELEAEHRLPEHLEGQDHGREAQTGVAPAGQDNGNAPSADHDRAPSCWWGRRHASDGGQRCPPGPLDDAGTTVINEAVRGSAARQRTRCGVARTR